MGEPGEPGDRARCLQDALVAVHDGEGCCRGRKPDVLRILDLDAVADHRCPADMVEQRRVFDADALDLASLDLELVVRAAAGLHADDGTVLEVAEKPIAHEIADD